MHMNNITKTNLDVCDPLASNCISVTTLYAGDCLQSRMNNRKIVDVHDFHQIRYISNGYDKSILRG